LFNPSPILIVITHK